VDTCKGLNCETNFFNYAPRKQLKGIAKTTVGCGPQIDTFEHF